MQYWDNVLYPPFRATIRGAYYGIITQDDIDEELYNLACRAIAAFKFPRISTDYRTFYAIRPNENSDVLQEVDEDEGGIPHGYFVNDLTEAELNIIIAWMKAFWCELQVSSSDNFEDVYTDSNIKTFSRANAVDKATTLWKTYVDRAKELEMNYGRVSTLRTPTIGDINSNEE